MKDFILCADDFSLHAAVDDGIAHLIENNRLSATSCMTNSPHWHNTQALLKSVQDKIDIGLHLNLTHGRPLTHYPYITHKGVFCSVKKLLLLAHGRFLNQTKIAAEINAQVDRFIKTMGVRPTFIDGHEHIHHLPIVRDALLDVYMRHFKVQPTYVRSVAAPSLRKIFTGNAKIKKFILQITGASALDKRLNSLNITHNTSFSGIYNFKTSEHYATLFPKFLQHIQHRGIIMAHPGKRQVASDDNIAASRVHEYNYLCSNQFVKDCQVSNVRLTRFHGQVVNDFKASRIVHDP